MDLRATITDCSYSIDGTARITLAVPERDAAEAVYCKLQGKELDISIKKHSEKRSLGANALMWKCLGGLAATLNISNMEAYIQCLRDYGTYTFIIVPKQAVAYTKCLFRIVEDVGEIAVGKVSGVQLQVWPGSSTYDVPTMTRLLNGVIQECRDVGAWVPDERDVAISIQKWGQKDEIL